MKKQFAQVFSTIIPAGILATGFIGFSALQAQAASLTFNANTQQGSDGVGVNVFAQDITGGIQFNLNVDYSVFGNTGDLLAAYLEFGPSFNPTNITSVTGALSSSSWGTNTNNIVGGNIGSPSTGGTFDLGVQLTGTGSSGGLVTSKTFSIFGSGLDVNDLLGQTFAVRLQTVGSNSTTGGIGSAKQFGTVPNSSQSSSSSSSSSSVSSSSSSSSVSSSSSSSSVSSSSSNPTTSVPEPSAILGLIMIGGAFKALTRNKKS